MKGWHMYSKEQAMKEQGFTRQVAKITKTARDTVSKYWETVWHHTRATEQRNNESIAVSFIQYFDISREDFERVNEETRIKWENAWQHVGWSTVSVRELYPVDLIFSFDSERIREHFEWQNSLFSGDFGRSAEVGRFRYLHYNIPAPFMELVGRWNFIDWRNNRSNYARENVNIAVDFVKYFNVSKEEFIQANELFRYQAMWQGTRGPPSLTLSSRRELYPVDLIFSFDNEAINEFFLWENSPFANDFGRNAEIGNFRFLHYNMPAPFMELVGRDNFINWRNNRSNEERANENIAVSFIRYFEVAKEDFMYANEEFRIQVIFSGIWPDLSLSSRFETYPVDLIFTFNNEAINEFFRWENSPAEHERDWGR